MVHRRCAALAEGAGRAARWLSALALPALTACAVGGALPAPSGPAPELSVAGADGMPRALSHWPPKASREAPRAVILGVHGFGDYGPSTFEPAAEFWSARGIATYAYDQRGFGRNPSHGRWPGAATLVADLRAVVQTLRTRHPCVPLVVAGHSMGGGVALAAADKGLAADGLVLAAPAIWGGAEMNPAHRVLAWTAAAVAPDRRISGEGVVEIRATDNIPLLRALARDPHYLKPPSARELLGLVRVADLAEASADQVDLPALLLLGEKDEIVPNDRVRRVFARLEGPRQVIAYPEGWHLLFRDLQAERVWRDVADWVLSDAPQRPACAPVAAVTPP